MSYNYDTWGGSWNGAWDQSWGATGGAPAAAENNKLKFIVYEPDVLGRPSSRRLMAVDGLRRKL